MKYLNLLLFFCLSVSAKEIEVTIVYGNETADKAITANYKEGTTALELLKQISKVEAVKNGKFTFVRSVDGVSSEVGKFGWFYLINGRSVNEMAENHVLKNAKSMTWIYKVEKCR